MKRPTRDVLLEHGRVAALSALQWLLRCIARLYPLVVSLLALVYVYGVAYEYWSSHPGRGRWPTTWPTGRTRLVLLMFAVPIWAACMAVVTLVWVAVLYATRRVMEHRGYTLLGMHPNGATRQNNVELAPLASGYRDDAGDDSDDEAYDPAIHAPIQQPGGRSASAKRHARRLRCLPRLWHAALALYVALAAFGVYMLKTYEQPDDIKWRPQLLEALRNPRSQGYHTGEKIFIAANFFNNERILPYWTREMSKVITYLGTQNVYVSIFESYSHDQTPALLDAFAEDLKRMGVEHSVITRDTSIPKPNTGITNNNRISFLSAVRNKVMAPLYERGGFDRVLFSNDIYVEAESVIALLRARNGDWDMVCSLDFNYWGLYDAWVIRDRLGGLASAIWPYFLEEVGMGAVERGEPAPVFSCWNGIVGMRADPFYTAEQRKNMTHPKLSDKPLDPPLPPSHPSYEPFKIVPPALAPPLRFRTSVEGKECFSSECFLIPYDFRRQFLLDKIFVVPTVLVAYEWDYYVWYRWVIRHWLVKWYIENIERGDGYQRTRVTMGPKEHVYVWDGGHCFPF